MKKSIWEQSRDPAELLGILDHANLDKARPIRLLACAFGRQVWHLLEERVGRPSVELIERFVDGRAGWNDLRAEFIRLGGITPPRANRDRAVYDAAVELLMMHEISARRAIGIARHLAEAARSTDRADLADAQCAAIREVFGDPENPQAIEPAWLTPTVVDLARGIHDDRSFDRMPVLGDALEEAGCWNAAILDHCRQPAPHVRGCWVVDRIIARR